MKQVNDFLKHKTFRAAFFSANQEERQMLFDYVTKFKKDVGYPETEKFWMQDIWHTIKHLAKFENESIINGGL